ncbi:PTS transporter subunit EIIC [Niallia alba]|nr:MULTISPECIES: PTS transporter subunit EIIC [Niallia]MCB5237784.1 PTS transporter subunit EIIC [Niallia circulans]MDU1846709.1 PTS transporter subunit EIIC [Niallia nealsonii]MED3793288.1 PTS transporter subunit EIIC [Niallia alba]
MGERNRIVTAFEKFGRSFLLPVSVLPAAGIIKGIGSAFTNTSTIEMYPFLGNAALQFFMQLLVTLGNVAFDNLPIIFAVGVAVGLAKHERGSAAISGLLGFFVLHYTLNFLLSTTGKLANLEGLDSTAAKLLLAEKMQTTVLGIDTMDLSVFGGIITGVVVYLVHKKAIKIQLPAVIGFFSGPRLVPILIIPAMAVVAVLFFYIWPAIQSVINIASVAILKSGYVGTFLYGVIERILLPFGLHHGLNWPVRTTELGGIFMIDGERVAGTINAYMAAINSSSGYIDPNITRFSSGKFVYNMFGLAGAALAMYHTANADKKKVVGSLLLAASGTAFLTGITEPLEFTFLFVAPVLYGVHAILTGLTMVTTHILGAAFLTPTGHGLINFIIYGVLQGTRTKWYLALIVGVFCFVVYYVVFRFIIVKLNLKTPGREEEEEIKLASKEETRSKYGLKTLKSEMNETATATELTVHNQALGLIEAHGGAENIKEVDACITRLRINVKDSSLVQPDLITKEFQALGFVKSDMQMQSIYGAHANVLKMEIRDILGMSD